ncbi:MAG TPA: glycosyltransferase family 1 protein [Acidimicrobiales bacterium]|nr:glycosyltransferase family 1 protein [Acidimicrobiales bacterium]
MRVLVNLAQLGRPVPGGTGTYARGLVAGLARLGPDAPALCLLGPARPLAGLGFPTRRLGLPVPLATRLWDRGWPAPAGFDLVHSASTAGPASPDGASCFVVHDLAWRRFPDAYPARARRWHEAALARALSRADLLVVPSQDTAADLVAAGADPQRVAVVEEGADHLPPPDLEGARCRLARLGVGGDYLLSVGTLEPRKNLARLLSAYRLARQHLPEPWPLVVVGPAGWGPRLDPVPGVVMAGPVPEAVLSGLLAGARLLAYVPLVEGFGLPPVEAMAAGVPVVASPVPSTGGAALEVDPRSEASIAEGLVQAATDQDLRARLVQAGARRAAGLTWEAAARRHVALWEAASRRRRPGSRSPTVVSLDVSAVPTRPAGAGRYVVELARALGRLPELRLVLVARRGDGGRWAGLVPSARVHEALPRPRAARLAYERARLGRVVAGLGAQVHHGPHYTMPGACPLPRVVTVHDLTFFDRPGWHQPAKVAVFTRAIARAAAGADALVCVSHQTARRLTELFPHAAPRVTVVAHGVDTGRFRPDPQAEAADLELLGHLGVAPPYLGFLGTLEPRKGLASLLGAFDRLAPGRPGLALVLAGGRGWGTRELEEALAACRHRHRVAAVGYLPDEAVPAFLRRAEVVAYPSEGEGFGLPVLEALACGTPVVTTEGTPMAEMAGDVAVLAPPGDPEGLARALAQALDEDPGARRRRVAAGLALARSHSWEAAARAHAAVYRRVASAGRPGRRAGQS